MSYFRRFAWLGTLSLLLAATNLSGLRGASYGEPCDDVNGPSCICGNGWCTAEENPGNCPIDCYCGDGVCSPTETDWPNVCPEDCGNEYGTLSASAERLGTPDATPGAAGADRPVHRLAL